jgi:hypothetical protein
MRRWIMNDKGVLTEAITDPGPEDDIPKRRSLRTILTSLILPKTGTRR